MVMIILTCDDALEPLMVMIMLVIVIVIVCHDQMMKMSTGWPGMTTE